MPINRNANFQTFPMALGLLFRCCTGEDWQVVMEGMYIQGDAECDEDDPHGSTCGVKYVHSRPGRLQTCLKGIAASHWAVWSSVASAPPPRHTSQVLD
jgi:hypothetical protein